MICALCNGRLHSGIFLGLFLRSTAKIIYAFITQCISEDRGHFLFIIVLSTSTMPHETLSVCCLLTKYLTIISSNVYHCALL